MNGRLVFGRPLNDKPLARRQMMKIQLPVEQALSFFFFTADALDKAEGRTGGPPSQEMAAVLRLATPLLKFRATRDGRSVTGDALEMRGGCGYIEDWINPRLLRDAHCGSIWEGAGNIVALDAMNRAVAKHRCHDAFAAELQGRLAEAAGLPAAYRDRLAESLGPRHCAGRPGLPAVARTKPSAGRRPAVFIMPPAPFCWLGRESRSINTAAMPAGCSGRSWCSTIALAPRDPLAPDNSDFESRAGEILFAETPQGLPAVAPLLA